MLVKPEIRLKRGWAHLGSSFLSCCACASNPSMVLCVCVFVRPSFPTGPPFSSSYANSSTVPVWSVLQRLQQRTKQGGISVLRLSAHAHRVTLNITKHSPSVTHNTTKHSSGAMLLKQTPRSEPQGLRWVAEELRRRMWGRPKGSRCLCWTASEWETHGTWSPCFPYPS